jgi:hypothetical protein
MKINWAFNILKNVSILIKYWTTMSTSKTPKSLYNILQYFRLKIPSFTWICFEKTHLTFLERIANELTVNRWDPFSWAYTPPSFLCLFIKWSKLDKNQSQICDNSDRLSMILYRLFKIEFIDVPPSMWREFNIGI